MRILFLVHARLRSVMLSVILFVLMTGLGSSAVQSPAEYFSTWGLSPAYLQEKTGGIVERIKFSLSSTEYQLIARVLDRFQGAPNQWRQEWADGSIQFVRSYANECQEQCRPVRMRGKIIQVIRVAAPDDVAVIPKWNEMFAVKFQLDNAGKAWVIVPNLPDGLPLKGNLDENRWGISDPSPCPGFWIRPAGRHTCSCSFSKATIGGRKTPLGKIGMDYGLFVSVDDGAAINSVRCRGVLCMSFSK